MSAIALALSTPAQTDAARPTWLLPATLAAAACLVSALAAQGAVQGPNPAVFAWIAVAFAPVALIASGVALHERCMDGRRAEYGAHLADAVGATLWAALPSGVALGAFGVAVVVLGGLAA